MNNGCICCTVRDDLIRIHNQLGNGDRKADFERVLIETTGLADPGPVAQTFFVDPEIADFYKLDAIVTVVDAKHVDQHLDDGHEAQEQVAFADVLLLNKTDLVSEDELQRLERRLRTMNSAAKLYHTQQSKIDINQIVGIGAFDLEKKLEIEPGFLEEEHDHEHDDEVTSIFFRETRPLELKKVERFLNEWLVDHGVDIFRYKGVFNIRELRSESFFRAFICCSVHILTGTGDQMEPTSEFVGSMNSLLVV